jgi:hypothetical protein
MQSRSVVDQETHDLDVSVGCCSVEWCFSPVIKHIDFCATLNQQLDDLEVAVFRR